jgi:hypothetical protein
LYNNTDKHVTRPCLGQLKQPPTQVIKKIMNILFIADPLTSFKIYKDTTFAMMREAQRRGHCISACEPQDLLWQRGAAVTAHVRDITLTGDAVNWFEERGTRAVALKDFDAILMRKDPPTASISTPRTCWSKPSAMARRCSISRARCATTPRSWRSWSFPSSSAPRW